MTYFFNKYSKKFTFCILIVCFINFYLILIKNKNSVVFATTSSNIYSTQNIELQPIPKKGAELLNSLPNGQISLDFAVSMAMKGSDHFKLIKADLAQVPAALYKATSIFDPTFKVEGSYIGFEKNLLESAGLKKVSGPKFSLGVSKFFVTGTALSLDISNAYQKQDLSIFGTPSFKLTDASRDYYETELKIGFKQDLLKNYFGTSMRKSLMLAGISGELLKGKVEEAKEKWLMGVVDFVFRATFLQDRVKMGKENVLRKERLFNTTKIKLRRGTAEKSDLLQVESSLDASRAELLSSVQDLQELWAQFVVLFGFPSEWTFVDASLIPFEKIDIYSSIKTVEGYCENKFKQNTDNNGTNNNENNNSYISPSIKNAVLQREMAETQIWQAKHDRLPKFDLAANLSLNGVDTKEFGTSFSDTFAFKYPTYVVAVQLQLPLFNPKAKGDLLEASAALEKAESFFSQEVSQLKTEWLSRCLELRHGKEGLSNLQQALDKSKQRIVELERSFSLGRTQIFNVILSEDETSRLEQALSAHVLKLRLLEWKLKKISGFFPSYLDKVENVSQKFAESLK